MLSSLPDDQELDRKRPMVSPAAVQRNPPKVIANEPQTASQARFQALKRRFETPPKTEEIGLLHGVAVKRQRLFRITLLPKCHELSTGKHSSKDPPKNVQWHLL